MCDKRQFCCYISPVPQFLEPLNLFKVISAVKPRSRSVEPKHPDTQVSEASWFNIIELDQNCQNLI